MKHKHFNRLLSMLLVVATLFGLLAVPASAAAAPSPSSRPGIYHQKLYK